MAVAIDNFWDFKEKFKRLRASSDLFAFFLFDDRESQKPLARFAQDRFGWLDSLAAAARIFFFIFLKNPEVQSNRNPSLEVGKMFAIRPNQLPGIVLFALSADRKGVGKGVFLPIKTELFSQDTQRVEEVFSDLFTVIQENTGTGKTPAECLDSVEQGIARIKRDQKLRPVVEYLKGTLKGLAHLPRDLVIEVGKAVATEATKGF